MKSNSFYENQRSSENELSKKHQSIIIELLAPHLSQIFGYHSLLYTPEAKKLCGDNLSIKHQIVLGNSFEPADSEISLKCNFEELPISSDCIDLAVLPNILQKSSNPHLVLREVERVLIPEGVVILIGRNPFSFHGLKTTFSKWRENKTHTTSDISKRRISDWFELLGFTTEKEINISDRYLRLQNSNCYEWVKRLSHYFCSWFCSYYIIIASKRVSTLTPIRQSWRSNKQLVPPRMAEPSVRAQVEKFFERVKPS